PAIGQLLGLLPVETPTQIHIEARPAARVELPAHARTTVAWHDSTPGAPSGAALVAAVRAADIAPGTRIWAAGEAASVQRIRRHLFEERGVTRADATIRGYWKHGRAGGESEK
ncbi:MAG TPA: SIP domain-containing protein, partial [Acidimicrobiia bacterium]|nr:SIP domain-containing protein [Acidimicrobiia bacterium]